MEFWEQQLERFRLDGEGTLSEQFLALRQEGTVREYRRQFEKLSFTLAYMSEHMPKGQFVNGLDLVTRAELLVNRPNGMGRILQMAQRIESKNKTLRQIQGATHGGNNRLGFTGRSKGPRGPMISTIRGKASIEKSSGHQT